MRFVAKGAFSNETKISFDFTLRITKALGELVSDEKINGRFCGVELKCVALGQQAGSFHIKFLNQFLIPKPM